MGTPFGPFLAGIAIDGFAEEPERFERALRRGTVDAVTVDGLEEELTGIRRAVRHTHAHPPGGPRALLPTVVRRLQALRELLERRQRLSVQRRLTHLGAQYAAEAGSLAASFLGDGETARSYLELALLAAFEADDGPLAAHALALRARMVLDDPQTGATAEAAREALDLVGKAEALAHRAAPATRARLTALSAQAHARLGDLAAGADLIVVAEDLMDGQPAAQEPPGWEFFDPSRFALNAGDCWVRVGDPRMASSWCGEALRLQGDDQRINSALTLVDLARARALDGDVEEAVALFMEAVDLPPEQRVTALAARAGELTDALAPHAGTPAVRLLEDYLRDN